MARKPAEDLDVGDLAEKKQNCKDEPSPEKDTSGRRIRPNHL
jgi:hypothetical protein